MLDAMEQDREERRFEGWAIALAAFLIVSLVLSALFCAFPWSMTR